MNPYYDAVATHRLRRPVSLVSFLNPLSQAVGRSLSALTGVSLVIVDEAVEHRLGASTHEIVPGAGLAAWRLAEAQTLARALASEPSCILVLGEGALTEPRSRELVSKSSLLVYLKQDLEAVRRRVESATSAKLFTLLTEAASIPGTPEEKLEALFGLRGSEYGGAGVAIDVGNRGPRHLAAEIAETLTDEGTLETL
jgi:shikimate kinase